MRATRATAASLDIAPEHVHAEALPQQKMELVAALQAREQTVAVVGDGINDAGAMAQANVSISLGRATDLARETADIVLLNDDLRDLIAAVEIARHAMRIVGQNRTLVVVPNVAAIAYGSLATLSPAAGAIINNGAALVAAFNSLRPLDGPGSRDDRIEIEGGPTARAGAPHGERRMIATVSVPQVPSTNGNHSSSLA